MAESRVQTRREAVRLLGGLGVVGLSKAIFPQWMPRLAFRAGGAPGDVLVSIFLRGGMDGLNVVVPFGEGAAYYDKRPTIGIRAPNSSNNNTSAVDLDGFFGLHPALRPLKDIYANKHLGVIHAAGSPDPTRSHFEAMDFMERGTPGNKSMSTGWISRHLQSAAWQNNSPFRAVGMGALVPTALQGPVSALALRSIAEFHLRGREEQIEAVQRTLASLYAIDSIPANANTPESLLRVQARETFSMMELLAKLSATEYKPANGATYPDTDFGTGLMQVAQLIKAQVGLEVACVDLGGWDTHENQGGAQGQQAEVLAELANGLAAFYADVRDQIGNLTVVAMSEFGRRAEENASRGTDHGHGNAMFVMGGGVNGGVYAKWPGLGADKLDEGDLAITTDYRDVLAEVLTARVLNPALDAIFPGYQPTMRGIFKKR